MRPLKGSIRIQGDALDPTEITQLLGVSPTAAGRKGELIMGQGKPRERSTGLWSVSLELPASEDWPMEALVTALLAAVPGDADVWKSLASRFSIDVFLGLFMSTDNQGFDISPALLSQVGARHWRLSVDIYGH